MADRIRIYDEVPPIIRVELNRFLKDLGHLVPDWCSHVWVGWSVNDSNNDSTVATITAFYDYPGNKETNGGYKD